MKGKFIVIEGTDCSGKETQTKLIEKKLKEQGYKCMRLSFPVYDSPTGEIVGVTLVDIVRVFLKRELLM